MLRLHSRRQFLRQSAALAAGACAAPVIAGNMDRCASEVEVQRNIVETLRSGAIGTIREAVCWSLSADRAEFQSNGRRLLGPALHALGLACPTSVLAAGTAPPNAGFPAGMAVRYEFPAAKDRRALRVTWYDGEWAPPYESIDGVPLAECGTLYLGSSGQLLDNSSASGVLLLCDGQSPRELPGIEVRALRSPWAWLTAWTGTSPALVGRKHLALVDRLVLAGLSAYQQQQPLQWDSAGMLA